MDAEEQVEKFKDFFQANYYTTILESLRIGGDSLVVDFRELLKFDVGLAESILDKTEETLAVAEASIRDFDPDKKHKLKIMISHLPKTQEVILSDIRSKHLNTFVSVEGTIRQKTTVRPQVTSTRYECPQCANVMNILQDERRMREPSQCGCGRKGRFKLISKEMIDVQKIVLEESIESLGGADQPQKIDIFLKGGLTSPLNDKRTVPGSRILVNGMIKEVPIFIKGGGMATKYDLCVEANFIQPMEETFEDLKITQEQVNQIIKLSKDPNIFLKVINSIAPHIEGYEKIKEALALQIFGGTDIKKDDESLMFSGNIHILLIGDPGSAKSQMLLAVTKLCPKSRYVVGKGASGVGLTASIVKDEDFQGGYALAAGVVVLANNGIAMLDEFDKIDKEDTAHLHSAMANQIITISKASIQATLKAATSILAAANPKFSRFDWHSPVSSQLNFEASLLNRFDLIFPVYDRPDAVQDMKIAKKILSVYRNVSNAKPDIDPKLLRAYVGYARKHIVPAMDEYIERFLADKYVEIRTMYKNEPNSPIPLNARQLIAIIKLATASAKLRLSNKTQKQDLDRAVDIVMGCLKDVGFDKETGKLDIDLISAETSTSQRSKVIELIDLMKESQDKNKGPVEIQELVGMTSARFGWSASITEELIEKLKKSGDIFEPKPGFLKAL